MKKKSFTVIELILVIVVVSILAAVAIPNYMNTKEGAINKEAKANLKLIIAANKIYKMENSSFYASSSITNINNNLKLALPSSASRNWNYATIGTSTSCAQATRYGGSTTWHIRNTEDDVTSGGC